MNRLTKKLDGSVVFPEGLVGVTLTPDNEEMFAILQRLAAYEDAGLTPDQASTAKVLVDAAFAEDVSKMERIRELMKADEDECVVVLPAKVGSEIYCLYDECEFPGDCHTKRKCQGCSYLKLFYEPQTLRLAMVDAGGKLNPPFFATKEEAERALMEAEQ